MNRQLGSVAQGGFGCYVGAVNFFGHATVACWQRTAPEFVLGAMLPDFANMSRARLAGVDHPDVADGMDLHHRTDAIFHYTNGFRRLYRRGIRALRARGLERGPAWGSAHVGVELLLDGTLVHDAEVGDAYLEALRCADDIDIQWRDEGGAERWSHIRSLLTTHGVPLGYREPSVVADRVARVLSVYPRLALDARSRDTLDGWLHDAAPDVEAASEPILSEVRDALG
jgi:hypothetical protein